MQTSQAYIFLILQHLATKLANFTNFNMLFLAVVKDFDFFAKMNIQFRRGMVHCLGSSLDASKTACSAVIDAIHSVGLR